MELFHYSVFFSILGVILVLFSTINELIKLSEEVEEIKDELRRNRNQS